MSYTDFRNAVSVGISGVVSVFGGRSTEQAQSNLLCENSNNLVQEDGSLILLE